MAVFIRLRRRQANSSRPGNRRIARVRARRHRRRCKIEGEVSANAPRARVP
jgi:hypothetical protein